MSDLTKTDSDSKKTTYVVNFTISPLVRSTASNVCASGCVAINLEIYLDTVVSNVFNLQLYPGN